MVEVHERLHAQPSGPCGRTLDHIYLVDGQRQRFLAQHMLAGVERPDGPLGVEVIGQRDIDHVYV